MDRDQMVADCWWQRNGWQQGKLKRAKVQRRSGRRQREGVDNEKRVDEVTARRDRVNLRQQIEWL